LTRAIVPTDLKADHPYRPGELEARAKVRRLIWCLALWIVLLSMVAGYA
jgi:hypothetical protein